VSRHLPKTLSGTTEWSPDGNGDGKKFHETSFLPFFSKVNKRNKNDLAAARQCLSFQNFEKQIHGRIFLDRVDR
jgi:hypothetical protein